MPHRVSRQTVSPPPSGRSEESLRWIAAVQILGLAVALVFAYLMARPFFG